MSNKDTAAELAAAGFRVFPLRPYDGKDPNKAKRPAFKGWQAAATDDPLQVAATWPSENHAPGVCTDGLGVLDFDVKNGGLVSLEALRAKLPRTYTVRTPSGGYHFYYRTNGARRLANRAFRVDKVHGRKLYAFGNFDGVDVRAEGGLAVGPGATVDGTGFYTVVDAAPIAPLPDDLADLADNALPPVLRERGLVVGTTDDASNIQRAIEELRVSPPAVEGAGGDPHTIAVANSVMDFGILPETCVELMLEHWNPRCSPPWDADDLAYKVASAARSRRQPIGHLNCDDAFAGIEGLPPEAYTPRSLLRFVRELSVGTLISDRARDLVRGLMSRTGFSVLYGDSGAGKSFLALDLAWALAAGRDWQGRRVNKTAVLYVCEEGLEGFKARVLAAQQKLGDVGDWFAMLAVSVTLARETGKADLGAQGAATIVRAVAELRKATGAENVLLVLDTLARVAAGNDENSVEDMMHLVNRVTKEIQSRAGCSALVVHHTNKAGAIRGSSALYAASDLVMRAEYDKGKGTRSLIAEKVKDGREGKLCDYVLDEVPLGEMEDGEPFGSCVVKIVPPPARRDCAAVARSIVEAAIASGVNLSPSARSANYIAKYCAENQPTTGDFSADEFMGAVLQLEAGQLLARENYVVHGKSCARFIIPNDDDAFTHIQPL
ncbi:MAG: AAA family ATPase [Saprospiraceae bacterium]